MSYPQDEGGKILFCRFSSKVGRYLGIVFDAGRSDSSAYTDDSFCHYSFVLCMWSISAPASSGDPELLFMLHVCLAPPQLISNLCRPKEGTRVFAWGWGCRSTRAASRGQVNDELDISWVPEMLDFIGSAPSSRLFWKHLREFTGKVDYLWTLEGDFIFDLVQSGIYQSYLIEDLGGSCISCFMIFMIFVSLSN